MPRIAYESWSPSPDALAIVAEANAICAEYARQGFDLTLRQLYYQFVARDLIPNNLRSYKRLGEIINRARLAGRLDWNYIVDRTRNLRGNSHWGTPGDIVRSAAYSFALDKWADQPRRVEVWVEKEALAGIVGQVASRHDVAFFSCRGYVSQSELWAAARRIGRYLNNGQGVTILHLGDHDPSGIDMTRDIRDRLEMFLDRDWLDAHADEFDDVDEETIKLVRDSMREAIGYHGEPIEVRRIALNRDQIDEYNPPPNPAKLTDSRIEQYIREHGRESWELDALDPTVLADLITRHILDVQDPDLYGALLRAEERHRDLLTAASERWADIVEFLNSRS